MRAYRIRVLPFSVVAMLVVLSSSLAQTGPTSGHSALLFGGVTLAPVRDIAEWAGAELEWQGEEVAIVRGEERIALRAGSVLAYVNGREIELPAEPRIIAGTTYAPVRPLAEGLGLSVQFDEQSSQVVLEGPVGIMRLPVELGEVPAWWPRGVPATLENLKDMEGRDLLDLVEAGKVEVRTRGSGIRTVSLELRRVPAHKVTVRIAGGTFLVSRAASAQNMVTTEQKSIVLDSDRWVSVTVPAACANRVRDIPGSEDTFDVQRAPNEEELARLMSVLRKHSVSYGVRQAAIWIVTDDADYDDLGTLVSRPSFQMFGGSRVIGESEAARALQICDEAGIDITQKAIWRDREEIMKGLKDAGLRKWLAAKSASAGQGS